MVCIALCLLSLCSTLGFLFVNNSFSQGQLISRSGYGSAVEVTLGGVLALYPGQVECIS